MQGAAYEATARFNPAAKIHAMQGTSIVFLLLQFFKLFGM